MHHGIPQLTQKQLHTQDGQPPSPEQIQEFHRNIAARAKENGITVPQMLEKIRTESLAQQAAQAQAIKAQADAAGLSVPEFVAKVKAQQQAIQEAAAKEGLTPQEYVAKMNLAQGAAAQSEVCFVPFNAHYTHLLPEQHSLGNYLGKT
jgi:hypothetical protein